MFGSVSKTRNRTCGLSVDSMSLDLVLEPDHAAEAGKAPAREVVDQGRGIADANPGADDVRHCDRPVTRPQPGTADRGQRRQRHRSGVGDELRSVPRPAAPAPPRSYPYPARPTTGARHARCRCRRRSRSRRVRRPTGINADRFRRQLTEHPPRATRQPSRQGLAVHQLQRLWRGRLRGTDGDHLVAERGDPEPA